MKQEEQEIQQQVISAINAELPLQNTFQLFRNTLAGYINRLITDDFEKLVRLLYRLDISEKKLKALLASKADADSGTLIADLIIERQIQKIQSRKQYSQPGENIPTEDKW
ncbi:MAG TPA: hypothetical protein PLA68_16970 [Panacibacter sp.]|nr:hypothetical protein [Panacibacter sp.]